jgi:hypothetical protein
MPCAAYALAKFPGNGSFWLIFMPLLLKVALSREVHPLIAHFPMALTLADSSTLVRAVQLQNA